MNFTLRRYYFIAAMAILGFSNVSGLQQEGIQGLLQQKVLTVEVTNTNIHRVLAQLATDYKIPIGVEVPTTGDLTDPAIPQSVLIRNGNVKGVLDAVIAVTPPYIWKDHNGVVNVYPSTNKEPILDIEIKDIKVENQSAGEIVTTIIERPELKAKLKELGLKRDGTVPLPLGTGKVPKRVSFYLSNVTVRDILNYLIKSTDNRYWVIYRVDPIDKYFDIIVW